MLVGNRLDADFGGYQAELWAGGTMLAQDNGSLFPAGRPVPDVHGPILRGCRRCGGWLGAGDSVPVARLPDRVRRRAAGRHGTRARNRRCLPCSASAVPRPPDGSAASRRHQSSAPLCARMTRAKVALTGAGWAIKGPPRAHLAKEAQQGTGIGRLAPRRPLQHSPLLSAKTRLRSGPLHLLRCTTWPSGLGQISADFREGISRPFDRRHRHQVHLRTRPAFWFTDCAIPGRLPFLRAFPAVNENPTSRCRCRPKGVTSPLICAAQSIEAKSTEKAERRDEPTRCRSFDLAALHAEVFQTSAPSAPSHPQPYRNSNTG